MSSVFLSHSHTDKPFVRKLAADLRIKGHAVWVDEAEIRVGDSLIEKISQGLDEVDYVAVVLTRASAASHWVTRELDIASHREISEGRVVVLPLLVEDVELPGFLRGKFYADFRNQEDYAEQLEQVLATLGPADEPPSVSPEQLAELQNQLATAKQQIEQFESDLKAHQQVALLGKSESLKVAILSANEAFPLHAPINSTYAFELMGRPVTLDYLLWSVEKARRRGSSPVETALTFEDKWDAAEAMLAAYGDLLDAAGESGPVDADSHAST